MARSLQQDNVSIGKIIENDRVRTLEEESQKWQSFQNSVDRLRRKKRNQRIGMFIILVMSVSIFLGLYFCLRFFLSFEHSLLLLTTTACIVLAPLVLERLTLSWRSFPSVSHRRMFNSIFVASKDK